MIVTRDRLNVYIYTFVVVARILSVLFLYQELVNQVPWMSWVQLGLMVLDELLQ